jgi:RND family efflux transporter MFP subunit
MRVSTFRPVAIVALALLATACSKPVAVQEPIRAVRTLKLQVGALSGQVEYAAEIKARTEARLAFRVGGKLLRRTVDLGSRVQAGQLLAQLDPQDLQLGQASARAALGAAQANADQVAADTRRYRDLREQGFISAAELDRREVALKSAVAQLDQARAQSGVQANQTSYASLVADVSGVVTGVDAEPGSVLAAGTPVLRVAQDGARDVVFSVPEDKVAVLRAVAAKPGALTVHFWSEGQADQPLRLREISAAADPATRTYQVKAELAQAGAEAVQLGQTATVRLNAGAGLAAIKLPLSAIRQEKGQTSVWILDAASMTVKPQTVQVAAADGNEVVIAAGLTPGQEVVTAGVHVLTPGQKVSRYVGATR